MLARDRGRSRCSLRSWIMEDVVVLRHDAKKRILSRLAGLAGHDALEKQIDRYQPDGWKETEKFWSMHAGRYKKKRSCQDSVL